MNSDQRTVVRSGRLQLIGTLFMLFAAGMVTLLVIVITSPGQSIDNPEGFTSGGRALTAAGCAITAAALGFFGVAALRVVLILDETRLVIRNPVRTTKVDWTSGPKFEIRNRTQDVSVSTLPVGFGPATQGTITYRYHEIVCVTGRQHIWIAATSKMRSGDHFDELLAELRQKSGQRRRKSGASTTHADAAE
jgi:hypothetical protein